MIDSLPLFLNLVKSHTLLYTFLLNGNVEATLKGYDGHGFHVSETSIILEDFILSESDAFDYIQLTYVDSTNKKIMFVPYDEKYVINKDLYFGEKTIYYNHMALIQEQGIVLKNPNKYCFEFLDKKASVSLMSRNLISVRYGEDVCKNF